MYVLSKIIIIPIGIYQIKIFAIWVIGMFKASIFFTAYNAEIKTVISDNNHTTADPVLCKCLTNMRFAIIPAEAPIIEFVKIALSCYVGINI